MSTEAVLDRATTEEKEKEGQEEEEASDEASDGVSLARRLGERLADEGSCEQSGWRWTFELTRLLHALGGGPGDHEESVMALAEATGMDPAEVCLGVHSLWQVVRVPAGEDALGVAVERAKKEPLKLEGSPGRLYNVVASIAQNLSVMADGGVIFLPRERVGDLLGKTHMAIVHAVALLVKNGVLREVCAEWSYAKGKCKTYTFHLPQAKG